jgi:hypothetical protein
MRAPAVKASSSLSLVLLTVVLAVVPLRGLTQQREPDFDRMLQQQAETDKTWRAASDGFMQFDKITYRSKVGDLDIPAFVFQPLKLRGAKGHPALVWVHENIRGHLYEHYIPVHSRSDGEGIHRHRALSTAAASDTARRFTTPSTTAATKWTMSSRPSRC